MWECQRFGCGIACALFNKNTAGTFAADRGNDLPQSYDLQQVVLFLLHRSSAYNPRSLNREYMDCTPYSAAAGLCCSTRSLTTMTVVGTLL